MSDKLFLNEQQVARMLNLKVQTLRNRRFKNRGLPFIRDGRTIRYDRDDVIGYMESKRVFPDKI